jgi:hypothetical protein
MAVGLRDDREGQPLSVKTAVVATIALLGIIASVVVALVARYSNRID